ncbi:MAG: ATP-binding protein [Brumimicrobium sp.]
MKDYFNNISKYNFWEEKPEIGFERKEYTNWLKQFMNNRLIKVLVGQRRTGKSYILRQLINHLIENGVSKENTLYINTEYTAFDFLKNYKALDQFIKAYKKHFSIKGKYYIFVDEVQQIEEWEKLVNSYSQDFTEDVEIVITGSNSSLLSGELATLLSGRYVKIQVYPFSFEEYIGCHKVKRQRSSFLKYLNTGGLPELLNLDTEETKRHYLGALRDTILLRDVIQRHQIKDSSLLTDVFKYLANNISTLTSITNLVNYFSSKKRSTTYDTIANYISYMEHTYIIHKCERFDVRGKEVIGGNAKYYLNDLSFKNFIYGSNQHGYGYLLENLVYLILSAHGYAVYVGHLRNKKIDFVAQKDDITKYIQVAYSVEEETTNEREKSALLSIRDNHEKWIITMDELPYSNRDGVKYIQAWELEDRL